MTVKTLLYEQGPPLERAVRAAFEELGYRLEEEGDMDLVAAEIGERAIFEVTGSEGAIDVNKLRQLRDYVETEEQRTNQVPRSILVGNHEINKPPEKRGQPFTDRCVRQSKVHGTCLLPTTELFQAVILSRQGKLDSKDFWASLMKTTGIFKL